MDIKTIERLPKTIIDFEIKNSVKPMEFSGTVVLFESVTNATIKARGHIIVHGGCGKCKLFSEYGSVFLLYGSMQEAHIEAGQNIFVKHTQNSILKAKNDIIIENSVFKSEISAGNKIISETADAKIIGGSATAINEIKINYIGNENGVETALFIESKTGYICADYIYQGASIHFGKSLNLKINTPIRRRSRIFIKDNKIEVSS